MLWFQASLGCSPCAGKLDCKYAVYSLLFLHIFIYLLLYFYQLDSIRESLCILQVLRSWAKVVNINDNLIDWQHLSPLYFLCVLIYSAFYSHLNQAALIVFGVINVLFAVVCLYGFKIPFSAVISKNNNHNHASFLIVTNSFMNLINIEDTRKLLVASHQSWQSIPLVTLSYIAFNARTFSIGALITQKHR